MQKNKKRKIAGGLAMTLAAVFLAAGIIDSGSNVVKAKEVFQDVAAIKEGIVAESGKRFRILEIVDKKIDYTDAAHITLGKEEIGYLIGGSEPYTNFYYEILVDKSQTALGELVPTEETPSPDVEQISQELNDAKDYYEGLLEGLEKAGLVTENGLLKKVEISETYRPEVKHTTQLLGMINHSNVSDGVLVKDQNGIYAGLKGDGTYQYVGITETASVFAITNPEEKLPEEPSVSEDTVLPEEPTVSDNELPSEEEETEETLPEGGTASENNPEENEDISPSEETTPPVAEEAGEEAAEETVETAAVPSRMFLRTVQIEEELESGALYEVGDRYSYYATGEAIPEGTSAEDCVPVKEGTLPGGVYQFSFYGLENSEEFRQNVFGIEFLEDSLETELPIEVQTRTLEDAATIKSELSAYDLIYFHADGNVAEGEPESEEAAKVLDWIRKSGLPCIIKGEEHSVAENIYTIPKESFLYKGFGEEIAEAERESFAEVADLIALENETRDETHKLAETLTPATAVQYILAFGKLPVFLEKSELKILELEPCYSFTYAGSDAGKEAFRAKYLPENFNLEKLTIIGMSTAEFCGKIVDLNVEYDMIYIGSNIDRMNKTDIEEEPGKRKSITVYEDLEMVGVVYAHTGDLIKLKDVAGLVPREQENHRYSGNDILKEQEGQLLEFLDSQAPIVVADDFFFKNKQDENAKISAKEYGSFDEEGTFVKAAPITYERLYEGGPQEVKATRHGVLDTSSYIYQFVKTATGADPDGYVNWTKRKYQNFFTEGDVNQKSLSRYINEPKLTLFLEQRPQEYIYTTKKSNGFDVIENGMYLQPAEDGNYYLEYELQFFNSAYTNTLQDAYTVNLYADSNMDGKFSKTREELDNLYVEDESTGGRVDADKLQAGIRYRVSRQLPDDFLGAVPWKLVVSNNERKDLRGAAEGITAVKAEKQTVRILQIAERDNLEKIISEEPLGAWATLLDNVPDFNVKIMSVEAVKYFKSDSETMERIGDINNYDMLIFGFDDEYMLGSNSNFDKERLQEIVEFANSGKCILFSHDNTSWRNSNSDQNNTLNMVIRDLTGLDRYGVTIGRGTAGSQITGGDGRTNPVSQGIEEKGSRDELEEAIFDSGIGKEYRRDIAFRVNTDQKEMVSQTQGISYSGMEHNAIDKNTYYYLGYTDGNTIKLGQQVRRVNIGAITEYPYKLPEAMPVALTHGQYYQLDLESDKDGDGEGDIVVWYTINDDDLPKNKYNASPNDVRNNYYIYNRGNITYTGMGHKEAKNQDEIKLFINTMIAAYRVAVKSPTLNIVEALDDLTDKEYDAIPYDKAVNGEGGTASDAVYRIYFRAQDNNFYNEIFRTMKYRILLELKAGQNAEGLKPESITINEEAVSVVDKTAAWPVHRSDATLIGDSLYNGEVHYIEVPLSILNDREEFRVFVEVQSTIIRNGKENISAKVYDDITVNKLQLFDLD